MNTPGRKHKPKDQLLSKPIKLKSDPAFLDMTGGEAVQADDTAANTEKRHGESS